MLGIQEYFLFCTLYGIRVQSTDTLVLLYSLYSVLRVFCTLYGILYSGLKSTRETVFLRSYSGVS